jgi:hypothetical protein
LVAGQAMRGGIIHFLFTKFVKFRISHHFIRLKPIFAKYQW